MENTTIKDVILDKKMDGYGFEKKDFVASGEITVTITLGEYRQLIKDCATAQARIDTAEDDKYSRNAENEALLIPPRAFSTQPAITFPILFFHW